VSIAEDMRSASVGIEIVDNIVLTPWLADLLTSNQTPDDIFAIDRAWPDSRFIASTTAVLTVAAPWFRGAQLFPRSTIVGQYVPDLAIRDGG
jgi:hypothetical protein